MATGTNGIATAAECNSIVSNSFGNYSCRSGLISGTTSSGNIDTTGYKYVNGTYTYYRINATRPTVIVVTITNSALRNSSSSGAIITSYNRGAVGAINIGVTTSSTSTTFSYYKTVEPNIGNGSTTTVSLTIPAGTWYIRINCVTAPVITNATTSSGTVVSTIYYAWQYAITTSLDYCPTYSEIDATGEFSISGSYADNQCVKYSDISVYVPPAGYITYTQNSNKTGNIIGFVYSGSNRFSGSTVDDWENFKDQYCGGQYMSTPRSVGTGVYELTIGSGTYADLETWQSGYYYLVTAPSSYMVEEIYLTSSQVSQLNAGTNLSLSGSGTSLTI